MKHRILFIITKSEVGGAQKFVKEQIEICAENFEVYLCTNQEGWLSDSSNIFLRGTLINNAIEGKTSVAFLFQLYRYIKQNKINLVVTNSANAGFYGRLAAFFASVPSCYYSHGWSSIYNGKKITFLLNFIERVLAFISQKVICVSENDYNTALDKIKIPPKKLVVIKNATFPIYTTRALGLNNNNHLKIIALARFANPKRIDLMVNAFKEISFATLYIAGSGPDLKIWQDYIQHNQIKNVMLLGEIKSFDAFYDYDVFMLISDSEGLPISAIEAMSAGLPLILSNVGGCPELIKNNGVLVDNNTAAIVNAVKNVSDNYINYQSGSIALYDASFNMNLVKKNYIQTYQQIIN
jgi:glycosyltransferase involved in cell wall biosynthesis